MMKMLSIVEKGVTYRNLLFRDVERVDTLIRQLTGNIVETGSRRLAERIRGYTYNRGDYCWLVAELEVDGKPLVVGVGGIIWYSIPSKGMVGSIEEVVVDKDFRGRKIGPTLVGQLIELARGMKMSQVKLTAKPDAVGIYENLGFARNGDEAMVLRLYPQGNVSA